jgi:hypothetical protein
MATSAAAPSNIADLVSRTSPPIPPARTLELPPVPAPEPSLFDRAMEYVSENRWLVGGVVLVLVLIFLYWLYLRKIFGSPA